MFVDIAIVVVVGWIGTGILSYGIWVHGEKRDFSYFPIGKNMTIELLTTGPISLLSTLAASERPYGFDLRPYTREERWRNFNAEYNTLTYTYKTKEQFDEEY